MDIDKAIETLNFSGLSLDGNVKRVTEFCQALDTAVTAMRELQQHCQIGTPEECREAVEKRNPKRIGADLGYCRRCGELVYKQWNRKYCGDCGQTLSWEVNENDKSGSH